jgi:hypothetical protein
MVMTSPRSVPVLSTDGRTAGERSATSRPLDEDSDVTVDRMSGQTVRTVAIVAVLAMFALVLAVAASGS